MNRRAGFICFIICFFLLAFNAPISVSADIVGHSRLAKERPVKKVYRLAGEKQFAPFSYVDSDGEFTGFSVELFEYIAAEEGIAFEYIPMELYQATRALQEGKVDAIIGMKYSAEQSKRFVFSEPYFPMEDAIVIPKSRTNEVKSLADLSGKTIAMQEDSVAMDVLSNVRRSEFQLALNQSEALQFLFMERADAFFSNKWTAEYYLKQAGKEEDYVILDHLGLPAEFAAAVKPENREFLSLVNRSLERMKTNGRYQTLYEKWFSPAPDKRLEELKNWVLFLLVISGLSSSFLILAYLWNKRLKKEVHRRTSALAEANEKLEVQRRAVSEANAFKTQIINHMYYGIVTFNEALQLTSLNERAKEMLGLTEEEAKAVTTITQHPLIRRIYHLYEEQANDNRQLFSKEIEIKQNGQNRLILFRLIPLDKEKGQKNGYLLTLADRSEAKMLEEKLATQEKMRALGQLVAGVAHEIRNPLTSMKVFVDLLPRKYEDPAFREELLKHVPEALYRMNRIVEHLLDYARPKSPRKKLFDVQPFIQSLEAIIQPTLRKQGVHLITEIEQGMKLYSDPDQLKQVMLNLMLNALDAMEASREKVLSIQAKRQGKQGVIQVTDTGCGMDNAEIPQILEPFYTTKSHGVGLGLTLCYQWMKENNGEMNIESQKGCGTIFTLMLPADKEGVM
ncbi:transporter substrate-binding domain-containing protein [Bacillus xiapuensis]|uniref:transporter substrate-binding domain-containing protein n=1 Tax=Bacillus xiapuensis TaxID=2014075 RepID=UPI000C2506CD|nr:transporter substrate-binding domain-containing protein [Bacillus xiapuensis]